VAHFIVYSLCISEYDIHFRVTVFTDYHVIEPKSAAPISNNTQNPAKHNQHIISFNTG